MSHKPRRQCLPSQQPLVYRGATRLAARRESVRSSARSRIEILQGFLRHLPRRKSTNASPGRGGPGPRWPRYSRDPLTQTSDTSFLTLTRAEAHSSANPAPNLVLGAKELPQWCAVLVVHSPSITARPHHPMSARRGPNSWPYPELRLRWSAAPGGSSTCAPTVSDDAFG